MTRNKKPRHLLEFKPPFASLFGRLNRLAHKQNKSRNQIILETLNEHLQKPEKDEKDI